MTAPEFSSSPAIPESPQSGVRYAREFINFGGVVVDAGTPLTFTPKGDSAVEVTAPDGKKVHMPRSIFMNYTQPNLVPSGAKPIAAPQFNTVCEALRAQLEVHPSLARGLGRQS